MGSNGERVSLVFDFNLVRWRIFFPYVAIERPDLLVRCCVVLSLALREQIPTLQIAIWFKNSLI